MSKNNILRVICITIVMNKWFDRFITSSIILNSILLATKDYKGNYDEEYESSWNDALDLIDVFFTVIFLIECLIKIIAMGFILHKKAYLRDAWNWIDFVIVVVSVASFTPGVS